MTEFHNSTSRLLHRLVIRKALSRRFVSSVMLWMYWWWSHLSEQRMSSGLPLLSVYPYVTDEANSCSELSVTVIASKGSCIWRLNCRNRLTGKTFPSAALVYGSGDTDHLKVLHPGNASFSPFRSFVC